MRSRILGVRVDAGDLVSARTTILDAANARSGGYVCLANVHMVVTASKDEALRTALEAATLVVADGMPLVWTLRRCGFRHAKRVAGADLTWALCRDAAARGVPVYFYGSTEPTLLRFRAALERAVPDLQVVGCEAPPMLPNRPPLDSGAVERISASRARLLFVGLGCPKQELWMARHAPELAAIQVGVGAAFDFIAGLKRRAPVWMRGLGLEWLHRLGSEPRRLWRRYLTTNVGFGVGLLRERLRR